MSEIKKLTQEEISSIKELQNKYNRKVFELGNIEIQIISYQKQISDLMEEKEKTKSFFAELEKAEADLIKSLETKYGAGNINIETGEITSL